MRGEGRGADEERTKIYIRSSSVTADILHTHMSCVHYDAISG